MSAFNFIKAVNAWASEAWHLCVRKTQVAWILVAVPADDLVPAISGGGQVGWSLLFPTNMAITLAPSPLVRYGCCFLWSAKKTASIGVRWVVSSWKAWVWNPFTVFSTVFARGWGFPSAHSSMVVQDRVVQRLLPYPDVECWTTETFNLACSEALEEIQV